jgi:hypothetical protein
VPVPASSPDVNTYQGEHALLRTVLRRFLVDAVESSSGAAEFDQLGYGAGAALDALLIAHSVDRHGRCRSCRRRGWLKRRRPVCLVYVQAHYWLRLPVRLMQTRLASDFEPEAIRAPYGQRTWTLLPEWG